MNYYTTFLTQEKKTYFLEKFDERLSIQYFVDRYGKIFNASICLKQICENFKDLNYDIEDAKIYAYKNYISFHTEIAQFLYPSARYSTDVLLKMGWILVGSTCNYPPYTYKKPSQSQINKMFDLGYIEDGKEEWKDNTGKIIDSFWFKRI